MGQSLLYIVLWRMDQHQQLTSDALNWHTMFLSTKTFVSVARYKIQTKNCTRFDFIRCIVFIALLLTFQLLFLSHFFFTTQINAITFSTNLIDLYNFTHSCAIKHTRVREKKHGKTFLLQRSSKQQTVDVCVFFIMRFVTNNNNNINVLTDKCSIAD